MPSRYRRDLPGLKAEIVGRVLAGASLRAVCGSPGMPCGQTVRAWAAGDAAFGAALLDARRRGAFGRLWAFDEAVAAAFLTRARAGETINDLLAEPGMPSRRTYDYWKATQQPFAEALFALRQRRDLGIGAFGRARLRAFDWGVADRVTLALHKAPPGARLADVLAADPALPCRPVLARWRREKPEFGRVIAAILATRRKAGAPVPRPVAQDVVDHIVEGGSFASYSRLPGGPARGTLRRWFRRDGAFAREVSEACDWREEWYADQVLMAAEGPGPVERKERAVAGLKRQLGRLRHRPGAMHVRARPGGDEPGG